MTTPKPTPASDDQVESLKLGLEKTVAYTLSGFAAHATMSILVARIEADRVELAAAREQIKAKDEEIARLRDALTTLENRLFGLAVQLHRHGLSAMVDFIRAALSKPEPGR